MIRLTLDRTPEATPPRINLAWRNEVETYVRASGKFRAGCAALQIVPFEPGDGTDTIYVPCCRAEAFCLGRHLSNYKGAGNFRLPEADRPWSPVHCRLLLLYFDEISCPAPCERHSGRLLANARARLSRWTARAVATALELLSRVNIHIHVGR